MSIAASCPKCAATYQLKDEMAGKTVRCRSCAEPIRVPDGTATAVRAESPKSQPRGDVAPRPTRRKRDEDDEDNDRPTRRRHRAEDGDDEPKKEPSKLGLILALAGGGAVLVIGLVVLLIVMMRKPDPVDIGPMAANPPVNFENRPADPVNPKPWQAAKPIDPPKPPPPVVLKPLPPVVPLPLDPQNPAPGPAPNPPVDPPPFANPNIIAMKPFNRLVFPRTPSRVVAVGDVSPFDGAKFTVLNVDTRKNVAEFAIKSRWDTIALSGDGLMMAGRANTGNKSIDVVTAQGTHPIGGLPVFAHELFFDFTSAGHLFVTYNEIGPKGGQKYSVVDAPANQQIAVWQGPNEDKLARAITPDRQFYGSVINRTVVVRRLDNLKPSRQLPFVPRLGKGVFFGTHGLAFSPDGTQVALLVEDDHKARILCWTWQTGTAVCDHGFEKKLPAPFGLDSHAVPIEWLPDASGWVIQGQFVIDKKSGKELMTLPRTPGEWGHGNRRFVDADNMIVAKEENRNKSLELVPFKRDELDTALKIAQEGGDPSASRLPPLAKIDWKGVKEVLPPAAPIGMKFAIEPSVDKIASPNIPVQAAIEDVVQFCVSPTHAAVVSLVASEKGDLKNKVRLERFDLRAGAALENVELFQAATKMGSMDHLPMPHTARFSADLSADGSRFALREPADKKRVDVWAMPGGKHVLGVAPYANEADPKIVWFGLSGDLLLTANARRLIAWKLPEGKAIYSLVGSFVPGSFAFSPQRKHLAVIAGREAFILDPQTGQVMGQMPLPPDITVVRVASTAFRPDGKAMVAMIPALANTSPAFSLEQLVFGFSGPCHLVRWDFDAGITPKSQMLQQSPGRVQWLGSDVLLAGNQVVEWSTGESLATVGNLANQAKVAYQSFDTRHWFVSAQNGPVRIACQTIPDAESVRLAKAIRENKIERVFGPGVPVTVVTEGAVAGPAVEQLKGMLQARKHPVGGGNVTLVIRLQEGGADTIRIRDLISNKITEVPGLSMTGEAFLKDAKGELWKISYKDSTQQGIGMIRANNLTEYFHKPVRDRAENWVRNLSLPRGIIRDGDRLMPYPRVITLGGD